MKYTEYLVTNRVHTDWDGAKFTDRDEARAYAKSMNKSVDPNKDTEYYTVWAIEWDTDQDEPVSTTLVI